MLGRRSGARSPVRHFRSRHIGAGADPVPLEDPRRRRRRAAHAALHRVQRLVRIRGRSRGSERHVHRPAHRRCPTWRAGHTCTVARLLGAWRHLGHLPPARPAVPRVQPAARRSRPAIVRRRVQQQRLRVRRRVQRLGVRQRRVHLRAESLRRRLRGGRRVHRHDDVDGRARHLPLGGARAAGATTTPTAATTTTAPAPTMPPLATTQHARLHPAQAGHVEAKSKLCVFTARVGDEFGFVRVSITYDLPVFGQVCAQPVLHCAARVISRAASPE